MKKCLIFTSHIDGPELAMNAPGHFDYVICADGGLTNARRFGIHPDKIIGDFDSAQKPTAAEEPAAADLIQLPCEKDMTDSEAAVDLAYTAGFRDITVLGGLGGRFDHSMGNLGVLSKYAGKVDSLAFEDGYNRVWMLTPGQYTQARTRFQYLGLIAYGGPVTGLTVTGVKYPLKNHTLSVSTTLGVSNEIVDPSAGLSFRSGRLLVVLSNDVK